MDDNKLVLVDEDRSLQWNYVNRVERELAINSDYTTIPTNPLLPESYKEVVMILARACNHSRIALLIDEDESYVAFMMVVDEDCIPFMLEPLEEVCVPTNCIYKVYTDDKLASSSSEDGLLREFLGDTVIPDLNNNIESWKSFKYVEE